MSQKLNYKNANEAFQSYLLFFRNHGGVPFSNTQATFNQSFAITNPASFIISDRERKWNHRYAEREFAWYESGDRSVKDMKKYAPTWDKMHDGDEQVWSNYGWWWDYNNQLDKVIKLLIDDRSTRRAVVVHYNPDYIDSFKHDTPCNLVLNFWIYAGKLNLTVFARSIDLWFGFCNDQYCFYRLMEKVAKILGNVSIGEMHWFITNFHLYNDKL